MTQELDTVLKLIGRLDSRDLRTVQEAVKAAIHLGPKSTERIVERGTEDYVVLDAIVSYMQSKAIDMTSRERLLAQRLYPAFKAKVPALNEYLRRCGVVNQQRAVLRLGIGLLHEDLKKIGLAVNSRLMMQHIHRVPGCINRAFPGYAEMGILPLITERKT